MPKTNEKDAYFCSHDCNARNDPKILALRSVYGAEGYGVYFMLVEILREQPEYRLSVNKYIWNTLAMQMQVEASHLEQIITDCCTEFAENGSTLLVNDGEYLYSASLLRRMGKVDDISNLRREAAQKRWKNQPCKADDGSGASTSNANAEQTDANKRKAKQYQNHFGIFTYRDIPSEVYPLGILLHEENGYSYQIATPEKALCDKLYSLPPAKNLSELCALLFDDLRIDEQEFWRLNMNSLNELAPLYRASNLKLLSKLIRRNK